MKKFFFAHVGWHRSCSALGTIVALAFAGIAASAQAGQNVGVFDVNIRLDAPEPDSCGTTSVAGGSLAIVCGTGGGSKVAAADTTAGYRLLTRREDAGATVDAYGGAIATTAVRVLNVAGRQFIEMTVGW